MHFLMAPHCKVLPSSFNDFTIILNNVVVNKCLTRSVFQMLLLLIFYTAAFIRIYLYESLFWLIYECCESMHLLWCLLLEELQMFTGSVVMGHLCFIFLCVSLKRTDRPPRVYFHSAQFPVRICFAFSGKTCAEPIPLICQHQHD